MGTTVRLVSHSSSWMSCSLAMPLSTTVSKKRSMRRRIGPSWSSVVFVVRIWPALASATSRAAVWIVVPNKPLLGPHDRTVLHADTDAHVHSSSPLA